MPEFFPVPNPLETLNPIHISKWAGNHIGADATAAKAVANAFIPSAVRLKGMTVVLEYGGAAHEYWYRVGIADTDLELKASEATTVSETDPTVPSYVKAITTGDITNWNAKINTSEKGVNNGVATLDSGGKVPLSQLPNSLMELQGVWNATTNTPTLADGVGNAGQVYEVTVIGTQNLGSGNITFALGDWVVYGVNGIWYKSKNSNEVTSVNGQVGTVVLNTSHITENTNLYYTNARVQTYADTLYSQLGHTHAFASLTSKPTTLGGYGIGDAYTQTQINNFFSGTTAITG